VKKGEDHICLANGTKGFSISLAFRDKGALPAISRQPAVSLFVSIYLHALASGLSCFFFLIFNTTNALKPTDNSGAYNYGTMGEKQTSDRPNNAISFL